MVGAKPFPAQGEYFWSLERTLHEVVDPEKPWQHVEVSSDRARVWFATMDLSRYSVLHKGVYSEEDHVASIEHLYAVMQKIALHTELPQKLLVPVLVGLSELTDMCSLRALSQNNIITLGCYESAGQAFDQIPPILQEQLILRSACTSEKAYAILFPQGEAVTFRIVPAAAINRNRRAFVNALKSLADKLQENI